MQRARLTHWLQANADPHATDGRLKAIEVDWRLETASGSTNWNNRGRH